MELECGEKYENREAGRTEGFGLLLYGGGGRLRLSKTKTAAGQRFVTLR
jgi:hypothetical protein